MVDFDTSNFQLDVDGTGQDLQPVPDGTFTWVRGNIQAKTGLRLRVQIPPGTMGTGSNAGRQLTVGNIFDTATNRYIEYGGQFADYISMGVSAVTISGGSPAPAQFCPVVPPRHHGGHHRIIGMTAHVESLAPAVGDVPGGVPQGLHAVRRL